MSPSSYSRRRAGAPDVLLSFAWAIFGMGLALVYPSTDWQATVGVLMISQAFCGALVWRRFKMTSAAVLPDFLTIFLFMQFVSNTLTALGQIVGGYRDEFGTIGENLIWQDPVPTQYLFQAELIFLLATVVFTLAWRLLEGRKPLAVWQAPAPKAMWWAYGLALVAYLVLSATPIGSAFGATLELMRLFSIGALAVLLGGGGEYALGRKKSWLPILALAPLYVLALRSGMKGEIALVSLPILLPAFRRMNFNRLLLLGGFAAIVVLFVFPFSQAWREANWNYNERAGISEVASQVFSRWEQNGLLETAAEGTAKWLSRGSTAEQGGLVMMIAERDGLLGPVLLEGLATIFVPRFLWPEKPLYLPGAWFTWYLGQASSPETATTATAMMLPTELYWMFGIFGVLFGMALLAVLYFYTWRYLMRRAIREMVPLVALFGLLATAGGLESIHTIYAISSPIILVVYVVAFERLQRLFSPRLSRMGVKKRGAS